jgi:DhnA family fructose-bisphosphate aldolase class Ia
MNQTHCFVPADVPEKKRNIFIKNYNAITRNTGRLFLFSCDHKIEHLNEDFYGSNINAQAIHPEHLFRIASQGNIGAMATQLGLIARYAQQYDNVQYIAKLNSKTNLVPVTEQDPQSALLWTVDDVVNLCHNHNNIKIAGVGITVYLGSAYESELLAQAAATIAHAHSEGLVTIVWMYPRGKTIKQENSPELIAGATGIAVSLGADFVKIKAPAATDMSTSVQNLKIACAAAGNTKVLCAGGEQIAPKDYLAQIYDQIHSGDTAGTATGRNIFQYSCAESIALTHAIAGIVYDNMDLKLSISLLSS